MIMSKNTGSTEMITKEAVVSVLFSTEIRGLLYKDSVFVSLNDGKPEMVYVLDNESLDLVPKAFDLFVAGTSSDENPVTHETLSNTMVSVSDFEVIYGCGVEVEVSLYESEKKEEEVSNVEEIVDASPEVESAPSLTGFSDALDKIRDDQNTTVDEAEETTEVVEMTRQERIAFCKEALMSFITDPDVVYSVKDLHPKVKDKTKLDIKPTEIRNYLVDLIHDKKLESGGKTNTFQLASFEQISLFGDEEVVNVTETVQSNSKVETVSEKSVKAEPKTVVQQPNTQPKEVQTVSKQVVQLEEELKQADSFSSLFGDDQAVRSYLEAIHIPSGVVDWAIKFRSHNRERLSTAPQVVVDVIPSELVFQGNQKTLLKSLAMMMSDTPLSLKGPAGTGKTTLVDTIGAILNLPVFSINGSLESNKSTLIGEPTIKQAGIISIKDGQMQKAAVYGGILYIDEINMMRPDVLSAANSFLDHRKSFYNDVRSEMTVAREEARFISAMNEGYAGTKQMNKATGDRKMSIRLDYMSKIELKDILRTVVDSSVQFDDIPLAQQDKYIEQCAKLYNQLSNSAKTGTVPELAASTRSIIQLIKNVPTLGFELALEMYFDKFTPEEINQIKGALLGSGLDEDLGVKFI